MARPHLYAVLKTTTLARYILLYTWSRPCVSACAGATDTPTMQLFFGMLLALVACVTLAGSVAVRGPPKSEPEDARRSLTGLCQCSRFSNDITNIRVDITNIKKTITNVNTSITVIENNIDVLQDTQFCTTRNQVCAFNEDAYNSYTNCMCCNKADKILRFAYPIGVGDTATLARHNGFATCVADCTSTRPAVQVAYNNKFRMYTVCDGSQGVGRSLAAETFVCAAADTSCSNSE